MAINFERATKQNAKLKMAICGVTGSGKTYSALSIAQGLGESIAVVDSEWGSASLYADRFDFDVVELEGDFHPERYVEAIEAADAAGYDVLIIDSLSHAWAGTNGTLALVDEAAKRMRTPNSFAAWKDVTPLQNRMIEAIQKAKLHIIVTMRSKIAYEIQTSSNGKKVPVKVGLAPIQRDNITYEFTIVGEMEADGHVLNISKTRCSELAGAVIERPDKVLGQRLVQWLQSDERIDMSDSAPTLPSTGPALRTELQRLRSTLGAERYDRALDGMDRSGTVESMQSAVQRLRTVEHQEVLN